MDSSFNGDDESFMRDSLDTNSELLLDVPSNTVKEKDYSPQELITTSNTVDVINMANITNSAINFSPPSATPKYLS